MKRIMILALALVFVSVLFGDETKLESVGSGDTLKSAINDALVRAVEQNSGLTVSSEERSRFYESVSSAETSAAGASSERKLGDSAVRTIDKAASDKVLGYSILEKSETASGGYEVRLEVRFPGPYVVGLDPANRRRMAIVEFRPYGETFEWYGQKASTVEWVKSLSDKLNVKFTKTRRFTMLERKFDAEVNDELARLNDANASKADVVRRCQKLGTDYLIVGEVRFFPVVAPAVNPLTGQAMNAGSQLFAEVTYRVLLAPTGQLKFADTVKIDAASCPAGSVGAFASLTTDAAAALILDGVMANYQRRDQETDGTESAPVATPTVNVTPVPPAPAEPVTTTVQGTAGGGVKVGF